MAERDLKYFQEEIRNGQRFQAQYAQSRDWRTYKDYYRHKWADGTLPVNQIFSIMGSTVAQVAPRRPSITVTPTKPGLIYELHAKVVETIDKWLIRELMVKNELRKMIQDTFLCGISAGFNGYDSEYGWAPKSATANAPMTLTQFDKKGYRIEYNANINPGMPWFLRARPDDVVYPWGATDKNNIPWVALRVLRPLSDLKKDKKYTLPTDLKGSHVPYRTGPDGEMHQDQYADTIQQQEEWIELWQVHDAKTGKIFVLGMEADKFLRKDDDAMQIDGLPVETLVFNQDPDYIYGIPDARIIEPQLLELNEIRSQAMKHRRIDILKFLYLKGAIDPTEVTKLLDEKVQAGIGVNDAVDDIRKAVMHFTGGASGILQDMSFAAEQCRQDIRETVGFSRVNQGEFQGKSHVTKSEVENVLQRSDIRMDVRRDAVADLLVNIIRKFNQTIFTYWTIPQVRDIVGPDGAKIWVKFTGPEIKGEYNYQIDNSVGEPLDAQTKKRNAMQMAEAWAKMNSGQIKQGAPIPPEIQRYLFSQYEGINVEKLLAQQGIRQQQMGSPQQAMSLPGAAQAIMQGRGGA